MFEKFNIAQIGDPFLRKKTKNVNIDEIKSDKIQNLINRMILTMRSVNGAGIAANQVYESLRICVVEVLNNKRYQHLNAIPLKILINPKISIRQNTSTFNSYEGCLSVPNLRGKVRRYSHIKIDYFDQKGEKKVETVSGFNSIVYQHEIDHLDGYLFTDKVTDNTSLVTYQNYLKFHEKDYNKELTNFVKNTKNLS